MLFYFASSSFLRHKILYQKSAISVNKSILTSCGARAADSNINITEKPISHNVFGLFLDFIPQSSQFSLFRLNSVIVTIGLEVSC